MSDVASALAPVWDGNPRVLQQGGRLRIRQTRQGSMIIGFRAPRPDNNWGRLHLTSAADLDEEYPAAPSSNQLAFQILDLRTNNLNLTNSSLGSQVQVQVVGYAPDLGPSPVPMTPGKAAALLPTAPGRATESLTSNMVLTLEGIATGNLAVCAVITEPGPDGIDCWTLAVNSPPDPALDRTSTTPTVEMPIDWETGYVYVVNLSAVNAGAVSATLSNQPS